MNPVISIEFDFSLFEILKCSIECLLSKFLSHEVALLLTQRYSFVSVPPALPTIIDHWGRQLNSTVGPHNEGDDVILTCRVIGGKLYTQNESSSHRHAVL
jgi:hypothetical protein